MLKAPAAKLLKPVRKVYALERLASRKCLRSDAFHRPGIRYTPQPFTVLKNEFSFDGNLNMWLIIFVIILSDFGFFVHAQIHTTLSGLSDATILLTV